MSISIRKEKNGFVLTNLSAEAVQPAWVFQGHSEEKVDEMLAQAKLILLQGPDETPLPDFGVEAFMRDEAPNETQM